MVIWSPTLILSGFLILGFAASSCSTVTWFLRAIFEIVSPFADHVDDRRRRRRRRRHRRGRRVPGGDRRGRRRAAGVLPPPPRPSSIGPMKNSTTAAITSATHGDDDAGRAADRGQPDARAQRRVRLVLARALPGGPEQLLGVLALGLRLRRRGATLRTARQRTATPGHGPGDSPVTPAAAPERSAGWARGGRTRWAPGHTRRLTARTDRRRRRPSSCHTSRRAGRRRCPRARASPSRIGSTGGSVRGGPGGSRGGTVDRRDGRDGSRRCEERRRLRRPVLAVVAGPRRRRRPVARRVAARRERGRRVRAGRTSRRTLDRGHRLGACRLVVRHRIGLLLDLLRRARRRGLPTGPVLERRAHRECGREAVRRLVRGRTRRGAWLGVAAVAVVRLLPARVAIVLERDEGARGSAVDDREPAVGHRADDNGTSTR